MTKLSSKKEKQRNQVKSRFYYLFWGTATVAVVAGQLYVGTGYRLMAESLNNIISSIGLEIEGVLKDGTKYY